MISNLKKILILLKKKKSDKERFQQVKEKCIQFLKAGHASTETLRDLGTVRNKIVLARFLKLRHCFGRQKEINPYIWTQPLNIPQQTAAVAILISSHLLLQQLKF